MSFSRLEKDEKTFHYLKLFIKKINESQSCDDVFKLDNDIQASEIYSHLKINGFSDKDSKEIVEWINKNGKKFRDYLNTIKIAALIFDALNEETRLPTWLEFCAIVDNINKHKICLDSIHY